MEKFIGKPDTLVSSKNDEVMKYRYWIDVKKNLSNSNEFILNH